MQRKLDTFADHQTWCQQPTTSDMDHKQVQLVCMEIHVQHTSTTSKYSVQSNLTEKQELYRYVTIQAMV